MRNFGRSIGSKGRMLAACGRPECWRAGALVDRLSGWTADCWHVGAGLRRRCLWVLRTA